MRSVMGGFTNLYRVVSLPGLDAQPCSTADDVVVGGENAMTIAVPRDPGRNTDAVGNLRAVARQRDATTTGS